MAINVLILLVCSGIMHVVHITNFDVMHLRQHIDPQKHAITTQTHTILFTMVGVINVSNGYVIVDF